MNTEGIYSAAKLIRNGHAVVPEIVIEAAVEYGVDFKNDLILYDSPLESMELGHVLTVLTTELSFYRIEVFENEVIFEDQTNKLIITNSGKGERESDGMAYLRALLRLNKAA